MRNNAAPIHTPEPARHDQRVRLYSRVASRPSLRKTRRAASTTATQSIDPEVRRFTSALARKAGGVTDDALRPGSSCLG